MSIYRSAARRSVLGSDARMLDDDDLRDLNDTELKYVPVSIQQLTRAVTQVESCEKCNPDAEIPFDWVLRAFANAREYVDYILPTPGLCHFCPLVLSTPLKPLQRGIEMPTLDTYRFKCL